MRRIKLVFKYLLSYLPETLPVGLTEFEAWADEVHRLSGLPTSQESTHQALANMILHVGPRKGDQRPTDQLSKQWFVHALRKGAANQIASYVFYTIQTAQAERKKLDEQTVAADLAKQAGVDTTANGSVDGQKTVQQTPS